MLILLPVLILLLTALAMAVLDRLRPRYSYHWVVAVGGAFLAWAGVWVLRFRLPSSLPLADWGVEGLLSSSPVLRVDGISWMFALALATFALAVILTDAARAQETQWEVWAGGLSITALGILAVMAGNPLTLVLVWVILDVVDLVILLLNTIHQQFDKSSGIYF